MPYTPGQEGLPATTPGGMATGVDGQKLGSTSTAAAQANLKAQEEAAKKAEAEAAKKEAERQAAIKISGPPNPGINQGKVLRYPNTPAISGDTDYVLFQFYKYKPPFDVSKETPSQTDVGNIQAYYQGTQYNEVKEMPHILLYMPEDISTGYKSNWQGKNFSNIGASMMKAAGGGDFTKKMDATLQGIDKAMDNLIPLAGAKIVSAAIGKITGESVSLDEFMGSTRGVVMNPNSELLFQGLDMRNFALNFKLVPRSVNEADQIEKIISYFKKASLPYGNSGYTDPGGTFFSDIAQLGLGGKGALAANYIRVPDLVRVSFMRGGGLNPNVPQYKMCALTQVDINYTPDGAYATTKDGRMVAYNLALAFQETKLVFREEIQVKGPSY